MQNATFYRRSEFEKPQNLKTSTKLTNRNAAKVILEIDRFTETEKGKVVNFTRHLPKQETFEAVKEAKKAEYQQKYMQKLGVVIDLFQAEGPLPTSNLDHALSGDYVGHRERHLSPDWQLIYKIEEYTLILFRTVSRSELFC